MNEVAAADRLLGELEGSAPGRDTTAPSMGRLKRLSYTHDALIDLIIREPELDQNRLAARFGYTPGWISNILASDAFKAAMALRREEVVDPVLKATIKERMEALAHQSLTILMEKLSSGTVSDNLALRAAELGAKALGTGGFAPPPAPQEDRLAKLAERLVALHSGIKGRIVDGQVIQATQLPAGDQGSEGGSDTHALHGQIERDLQLAGDAAAPK